MAEIYKARLSVRNLVEFILRNGDLDNTGGVTDTAALKEGIRLHSKIQNAQPGFYQAEVVMSESIIMEYEGEPFQVILDGRADGVIRFQSTEDKYLMANTELAFHEPMVFIDEIKTMYAKVENFEEPELLHLAQAKCYAYFYLNKELRNKETTEVEQLLVDASMPHLTGEVYNPNAVVNGEPTEEPKDLTIGVQLTYCNIDTENIRYFTYEFSYFELKLWFEGLIREYLKWMYFEKHHIMDRDASIKPLEFPFTYRPGQKDLVKSVYLTILREKKIFAMAPTGVGKTMAMLYPSVKALGEGLARKIFYATAKTITRTVPEEAMEILKRKGLAALAVTLTAKEKLCLLDKPDCNPKSCERAKGHEDRGNDAVYDIITHEKKIDRDTILAYAEKHQVCPFEFSLDVSLWCDVIICDYNYCFDPNASLKRFFNDSNVNSFILLADESHNLVERAREMYSASLSKEALLKIKPLLKERVDIFKYINRLNRALLKLKKQADEGITTVYYEECSEVFDAANSLNNKLYSYVTDRKVPTDPDVLEFFFDLRYFMNTLDLVDENYIVTLFNSANEFTLKLSCMNPRARLMTYMNYFKGASMFSATLLPVKYYMDQLSGTEEDYAVYAESPFDQSNRCILLAGDVSAKYTRRTDSEYERFALYIKAMVEAKRGNYLVFFPSYRVMDEIGRKLSDVLDLDEYALIEQSNSMSEEAREEFLECFSEDSERPVVGLCVMGGIFSEGIDLKADRLIGVAIVGTGLPQVCDERELLKNYYDEANGQGFDYSYLYPGMNKVLQAGGRVIRTETDRGVILLLDERFSFSTYRNLFPKEWKDFRKVNIDTVSGALSEFWDK